MKRSPTSGDNKKGQNKPTSSPSFFQRIASFMDSPCSHWSNEALREDEDTYHEAVRNESTKSHTSKRQIRNRSSAPRQIRQQKLNELRNRLSLHSHDDCNNPLPSPSCRSPTLHRVKSLIAVPTPSPTSVADTSSFWAYTTDEVVGNESIFSSSVGWCCNGITTAASFDHHLAQEPSTAQEACDGYVDYVGTHHPHTPTNCKGCIYRQSLFDESKTNRDEDLYYDSDCVDLLGKLSRGKLIIGLMNQKMTLMSQSKKKRSSYSPVVDAQQQGQPSPDRKAYMYDYFIKKSNTTAPLRTGICTTAEADVGANVQVSSLFHSEAFFVSQQRRAFTPILIQTFSKEALNSTWRLLWHTTASPVCSPRPLSSIPLQSKTCNVWIERGYRRNVNQAVEPRLMWREVTSAHSQFSDVRPFSLSLMAIRRIVPLEQMESCPSAFVKPNCVLVVRSSVGKDFYFEASSCEERDRTIHLWKMVTARLVSYAVTQNSERMMNEFFNEYTAFGD